MTTFEKLLLKTGSPALICAYVNEFHEHLSNDFYQNLSIYQKEMAWTIANALSENHISSDLMKMKILDFINSFGSELTQSQETHLKNMFYACDIHTVEDLLNWRYRDLRRNVRGMGEVTLQNLTTILAKAGLKLQN